MPVSRAISRSQNIETNGKNRFCASSIANERHSINLMAAPGPGSLGRPYAMHHVSPVKGVASRDFHIS